MKKNLKFVGLVILLILFSVVLIACGSGGGGGGNDNSGNNGGDNGGGNPIVTGTSINLPKTGQTTSYATGDDGALQKGIAWPNPRFTDNGNGTVTDKLTGLVWLKNANCFGARTWANALTDANALANGQCGLTDGSKVGDWRLPNKNELLSLIDRSKYNPALQAGHPFINVQTQYYYWSSTTSNASNYISGYYARWVVGMEMGDFGDLDSAPHVWPVRGGEDGVVKLPQTGQTKCYDAKNVEIDCANTGQDGEFKKGVNWPNTRFTVNGDCITDILTGLMWTKNANLPNKLMKWDEAIAYAINLSLCGYSDWRMPNINELESLMNADESKQVNWLTAQGFTNVEYNRYWSSTTYAKNNGDIWCYSGDGGIRRYYKFYYTYIWPVRGGQ